MKNLENNEMIDSVEQQNEDNIDCKNELYISNGYGYTANTGITANTKPPSPSKASMSGIS